MEKVYIIAEAGVNHNGDLALAKQMVLGAKKAGANAIKFQTFYTENLVTSYAQKAQYQKQKGKSSETQFQMLKKLEISYEEYVLLKALCESVDITFLSTPFDLPSIELLERLNLDCYKVPSGEITDYPYLVRIAKTHKPVLLSTGMSSLKEVDEAVQILRKNGTTDITLLHCNTQYPTPMEDVNLSAMQTLKKKFNVQVGYSDHTLGIEIPIAAVAMGAKVIEKHFTLNKKMEGPDHKASLEPQEFSEMVRAIRSIENAIGNGSKYCSASERSNIVAARKSIVASKDIRRGEIFSEENLTTKRPGDGISPMMWLDILGKTASSDFKKDEMIRL